MKDFFNRLIKKNQLAHGYLFFGADPETLKNFCRWLVETIEGKSGMLTDSISIEPIAETISIDQVREMKQSLWQKPLRAARKTAIILRAEQLTVEAQNAVLKIAEEPPALGLLLLAVKDYNLLLPTLVSRLQKIYLPPTTTPILPPEMSASAKKFLKSDFAGRRAIIKAILEQNEERAQDPLPFFVTSLFAELRQDPRRHWRSLKELLYRWRLINQFNVNKRLQLEAFARIADYE